ncbi:MAG: hypothetical protein ACI4J2_04405 [Ruminococcus sp.]
MKKIIAGVIAFAMTGWALPCINCVSENTVTASATDEFTTGTYENFTYINHGDYIEISDCDKSVTEQTLSNGYT